MHDFFSALINHQMIKSQKFLGTHQVKMVDNGTEKYNHSMPKGPSAPDYLALSREGSVPDCFVEELVDKGAEKSIRYSCSPKGSLRSRLHTTHQGGLRSRLLALTQEGSPPDCFVEELVDKGAEKSILMQPKRLPPLQITYYSPVRAPFQIT
jgi:hypothetical protein